MRVIAGRAKGHSLKGPPGTGTRPTSDKVRGAIFAMLESLLEASRAPEREGEEVGLWEGRQVLDLYAGTGALGIEALSRGASRADFVETNPAACKVIRENLVRTKLAASGRVYCTKVGQFLRQLSTSGAQGEDSAYDLVVMDPPYDEAGLTDVLAALASEGLVREGGWLVVEHWRKRPLPDAVADLVRVKARRHGDTDISIYTRRRSEELAVAVSGDAPGCE
jgi:16S rRNA (guanine(966)-N(2))-methyltransferase RsmD